MAFFNLTYLGNQDPFRTASGRVTGSSRPPAQPWSEGKSRNGEEGDQERGERGGKLGGGDAVEKSFGRRSSPVQLALSSGGEAVATASETSRDGPTSHTAQLYGVPRSASQPWHHCSHVRYTELLHKHKRNPKGALGIYSPPKRKVFHRVANLYHFAQVLLICTSAS